MAWRVKLLACCAGLPVAFSEDWLSFNDANVSVISTDSVQEQLQTPDAYVVIYRRQGSGIRALQDLSAWLKVGEKLNIVVSAGPGVLGLGTAGTGFCTIVRLLVLCIR